MPRAFQLPHGIIILINFLVLSSSNDFFNFSLNFCHYLLADYCSHRCRCYQNVAFIGYSSIRVTFMMFLLLRLIHSSHPLRACVYVCVTQEQEWTNVIRKTILFLKTKSILSKKYVFRKVKYLFFIYSHFIYLRHV